MIGHKQGHKIRTIDLPITTHTRTHTHTLKSTEVLSQQYV